MTASRNLHSNLLLSLTTPMPKSSHLLHLYAKTDRVQYSPASAHISYSQDHNPITLLVPNTTFAHLFTVITYYTFSTAVPPLGEARIHRRSTPRPMIPTPAGKNGSTTVATLAVGLIIFLRFAAAASAAAVSCNISCCCSYRRLSSTEVPRCLPAFTASAGEARCRTAVALCAGASDANDSAAAITH